jgi:type VI secretion system protein ImpG
VISERERRSGSRTGYGGSELYLSLVDARNAPYSPGLRQLSVEALCTNRDLPLQMPVGKGRTDFALDIGAPVEAVRVVAGPTPPRASYAEGDASWRLVSHLALNYLSLTDEDLDGDGQISAEERQGAASLRDLLRLYGNVGDPAIRKQIDGLRALQTKTITRRVPSAGTIAFARGLEVSVTLEESLFEGTGIFLLGSVLEQFFARYVTMNSFTETVVCSVERGEIMRWNVQVGQRPTL